LPNDKFCFEGFLPVKKGRRKRLSALKEEHRTIILYEAPHRLLRTLSDINEFLGNRSIAVCRELTKKYEEIIRGSTNEIIEEFSCRKIRGEFVIIIQGYSKICQNNTKNQYQIG
ncbi:16S rRNA (cytidine(1402)-2'-O)-methyltransferase, partial [bacterium]|nr:16S rRNA (cytidine(1402)-2'-O)-methyltransferase [bacterium]